MAPVPPGDKTGLYYILVANLPWSCTWQKLKDFARNHPDGTYLNVDHAYVYPGSNQGTMCSGYGWVRINGKADFKKALAHLNGGVFENRPLMADGRNETSTTHLRDIVSTRQSPTRSRQDSSTRIDSFMSPPVYQQSAALPLNATYGGQENYENWNNSQLHFNNYAPLSPTFPTSSSFYTSPPPSCEAVQGVFQVSGNQECYTIPTTTVFYVGHVTPVYPCLPPAMAYMPAQSSMQISLSYTDVNVSANVSQGIVQPEARKIIVTRLPHDIKDADLNSLVSRVSSKYRPRTQTEKENPIHSVDLPRYPNGKPKGHAFVVYDSQALAEHAVAALNGMKFQSRALSAKLAKEGVEPVGGYGNPEAQFYWPPLQTNPASAQPSNGGGETHVEGSGKEKKSEKRESSKAKEREKEKKEKENRQPLVVDGSGGSRRRR